MKKVIFACVGVCMLASCEKENLYKEKESTLVIEEKFMMQQAYTIPMESGKISVVTLDEDTLAITDVPISINIPLDAAPVSRAEDNNGIGKVKVVYAGYKDLPAFEPGSYITTTNHTLFFEDSKSADYDYNDLVLHVRTVENGKVGGAQAFKINVRGLAMGGGKKIGFGVTDRNGNDYDLTDDARRDYFGNKTGILNTQKGQPFVVGIEAADKDSVNMGDFIIRYRPVNSKALQTGYVEYPQVASTYLGSGNERKDLAFYIKVDNGTKLYVGEYDKNMEGALPYGIRTPEGQNFYPLERVGINEAFPQFMNWVKTGHPTDWNSTSKADPSKCYSLNSGGLWRW